jgi:hypothetical protein
VTFQNQGGYGQPAGGQGVALPGVDTRVQGAFLTQSFFWMFAGLLLTAAVAAYVQYNEGLLGGPRQHPEQIGETVQIGKDVWAGDEAVRLERHDPAFGAAHDGPGELDGGAGRRLARDDELRRHHDVALGLAKHRLEPLDHRRIDARHAGLLPIERGRLGRKLRGGHEQLALEPQEDRRQLAKADIQRPELRLHPELGAGDAERGDRLVDRAVRLGPEVVFADAVAAEQQPGRPIVASAGRDRRLERHGARGGGSRGVRRGGEECGGGGFGVVHDEGAGGEGQLRDDVGAGLTTSGRRRVDPIAPRGA